MTNRKSLTDFDKLIIAQSYVEELKKDVQIRDLQIGILQSEKAELIDLHRKDKKNNILKIKEEFAKAKLNNNALRKENEKLLQQIINLNIQINASKT